MELNERFEQVIAPLRAGEPDSDMTAAAREAACAGTYYRTLRDFGVPPAAARELTLAWIEWTYGVEADAEEDD